MIHRITATAPERASRRHAEAARVPAHAPLSICIALPLVLALAGCTELDGAEPDVADVGTVDRGAADLGAASAALTSTGLNPIECGHDNGRRCEGESPVPHNRSHQVTWDPCYGGKFKWVASGSFETNFDRMCIGGVATAGSSGSCSAGTQLNGTGPWSGVADGAITISIATDVSVNSTGLDSLVATCDEPLFTGVFRPRSGLTEQYVVTDKTWNQFIQEIDERVDDGQRLSQVELWYGSDGNARFDGVFVPGSGGYGFNAGMTLQQLRDQEAANALNGMELSDIEVQQTGGSVVYIGVWRAGTRAQEIYDGPVDQFWTWNNTWSSQGYQPTIVESYYVGSTHHYTVVVTKTPGQSGWWATVGVEYPYFASEWKKHRDLNRRLIQLETHVVNGIRKYDGFFVPGTGAEDFIPGSRWEQFDEAFDRNTTAGLELIDFDRHKLGLSPTDAKREEVPVRTDYPVVSPVWMAEAEKYFQDTWSAAPVGYTVALMQDGELLGATSAGHAQSPADGNIRMTPEAQWDYLSVSKWITTLAAAKVLEEYPIDPHTAKILAWIDDRLGLTYISTNDPDDYWHITVWDAMTHRSNMINGGCGEAGTAGGGMDPSKWTIPPGPAQMNGPRGTFNYSGFNHCMLRVWVEEVTGMPFERYLDLKVFRPMGIHNLDCKKDPEKVEVYVYDEPGDTGPGFSIPNTYCNAGGFRGNVFEMLKLMQGVRHPGLALDTDSLADMRNDEWTLFKSTFDTDGVPGADAWGYSMTGGTGGMATHIAQFKDNPTSGTNPWTVNSYTHGLDAVFFTNSGPGAGYLAQWRSVRADPTP